MKNKKSPGYDEISGNIIEVIWPIGMQWLYWGLEEKFG
jgi:hypothetical protein